MAGTPTLKSERAGVRDPAIVTRRIATEPLRLALPRDHRLARQPRVDLAGVSDEPFVGLRPASALRQLTDELCAQAGFRPAEVFEGDDLSTIRGFVAAGLGIAILPAPRAGTPEAASGPVLYREIDDARATREICLSWAADRRLPPAAELFRRHVISRASAGRLPALAG